MLNQSIMHYNVIRKDRAHCKGGGVCAFVNKRWHAISTSIDAKFDDCEVICFDCLGSSNHVRVRFLLCTDHLCMIMSRLITCVVLLTA